MNRVTIHQGDVLQVLGDMPDESVQCCVTSPPYWGLRDYGCAGQIGLELTIKEYVAKMVEVFREVRRVLRKDGTLWLNLGDSYMANAGSQAPQTKDHKGSGFCGPNRNPQINLKPKDLCMIPARVALALQADGWWLRSDIVWSKPNPMPESVTDRPTTAHEHIFLLTKSARYFYDSDAVREAQVCKSEGERQKRSGNNAKFQESNLKANHLKDQSFNPNGRNLRSVWEIATAPFPEAHFATYPPELVRRCVAAGTSENGCCPKCGEPWTRVVEKKGGTTGKSWHNHKDDLGRGMRGGDDGKNVAAALYKTYSVTTTGWVPICSCKEGYWEKEHGVFRDNQPCTPLPCTVLDPFGGSGTTGLVAAKMGRDAILIELKPEYAEMAAKRIRKDLGMLAEVVIK